MSSILRPLRPAVPPPPPSSSPSPKSTSAISPVQTPNRRTNVSSACQHCRTARRKCDGRRPCTQCVGSRRECLYRADHRTRKYRQTLVTERNERTTELDGLLHAIRTSSEAQAFEILRSLRSGTDVSTALMTVEGVCAPTAPISPPRGEIVYDIPQSKGAPAVLPLHGLLQPFDQAASCHSSSERISVQWTTVTQNPKVINYLLGLYFAYHHPICPVIPEPLIRADMASGRTRYCSPVLINAILAVACTFLGLQDDVQIADDPWPPIQAFLNEAERLLSEHPEPSLTAVAALCLLAMVENLHLHRQAACKLSNRASCMALFLGLHQRSMSDREQTVAGADEWTLAVVQQQLFWVCFQVDQMASKDSGYPPQIIVGDFEIRPPDIADIAATKPWDSSAAPAPFLDWRDRGGCSFYLADLAKIVHTTMFPPGSLSNGRKGADIRNWECRYQAWYSRLPASLAVSDTAPGHVIAVHMWYHGCLIQSFRHVSTPSRGDFSARALQICQAAAKAITDLFSRYRGRSGLRGMNAIMCQAMVEAFRIHLDRFPLTVKDLLIVVEAFQELSKRQQWASMWLKRLESDILHSPVAKSAAMVEALFGKHENTSEKAVAVQECSSERTRAVDHTNASTTIDLVASAAPPNTENAAPIRPQRWNEDYFFSPFARH